MENLLGMETAGLATVANFLKPEDAAARLGLTTSGVLRLIRARRLPACKFGQGGWRVPTRALEEFVVMKEREAMASLKTAAA